jgi:hypothetical protein
MTYVSWAALYEGTSDQAYFEMLIPCVMEELIMFRGTRHSTIPPAPAIRLRRGTVDEVAREACATQNAFHLVFIHADTGGRAREADLEERSMRYCEAMRDLCNWLPCAASRSHLAMKLRLGYSLTRRLSPLHWDMAARPTL